MCEFGIILTKNQGIPGGPLGSPLYNPFQGPRGLLDIPVETPGQILVFLQVGLIETLDEG